MVDKTIILSKDPATSRQELSLVEGDNNSYIVRFVAPRYSGGIDLRTLSWGVCIRNANSEEGYISISNQSVSYDDDGVFIEWNVGSFITSLHGTASYTIEGRNSSHDLYPIWKSSLMTMRVQRAVSSNALVNNSNIDSITEIANTIANQIVNNSVRFDVSQTLLDNEKVQARENIDVASNAEFNNLKNSYRQTRQNVADISSILYTYNADVVGSDLSDWRVGTISMTTGGYSSNNKYALRFTASSMFVPNKGDIFTLDSQDYYFVAAYYRSAVYDSTNFVYGQVIYDGVLTITDDEHYIAIGIVAYDKTVELSADDTTVTNLLHYNSINGQKIEALENSDMQNEKKIEALENSDMRIDDIICTHDSVTGSQIAASWVVGTISAATGGYSSNNKYAIRMGASSMFKPHKYDVIAPPNSSYHVVVCYYVGKAVNNANYIRGVSGEPGESVIIDDDEYYIAVSLVAENHETDLSNNVSQIASQIIYVRNNEKWGDLFAVETFSGKRTFPNWLSGTISAATGGYSSSNKYGIRTGASSMFIPRVGDVLQLNDPAYKLVVGYYTDRLINSDSFYKSQTDANTITIDETGYYIGVSIIALDTSVDISGIIDTVSEKLIYKSVASKLPESPYDKKCDFGTPVSGWYRGRQESYDVSPIHRNYDALISAWDDLASEAPEYMSKTMLGPSSYVVEGSAVPLYLYTLNPVLPDINLQRSIPKIIIIAGQQGGEDANVYGLYFFVKDLVEKFTNDPILGYLRTHVQMLIIPHCNPYGFNNGTYWNANLINLNRNYDYRFEAYDDPTHMQSSGNNPFDQPETQLIRNLVNANLDAFVFVDSHTNGGGVISEWEKVNWINVFPTADKYYNVVKNCARDHVAKCTAYFKTEFNLSSGAEVLGYITDSFGNGTAKSWVSSKNIIAMTFEGFGGFVSGQRHSEDCIQANAELIGNWLTTLLNTYNN